MPQPPKKQSKLPPKPGLNPAPTQQIDWRGMLWHLPFILLLLWMWQDVVSNMSVQTIPYSDIDEEEVKQLLEAAYVEAKQILTDHRDQLDAVAQELLAKETLDAAAFNTLLGRTQQLDAETLDVT